MARSPNGMRSVVGGRVAKRALGAKHTSMSELTKYVTRSWLLRCSRDAYAGSLGSGPAAACRPIADEVTSCLY